MADQLFPTTRRPHSLLALLLATLLLIAVLNLPRCLPLMERDHRPLPGRFRSPPSYLLVQLPVVREFDMPIGTPHGAFSYNAQPFGKRDVSPLPHLGDDLNGIFGGNTDLGDPVRAIAEGLVIFAGEGGRGWGKIVIVLHLVDRLEGRFVQSFYAHLDTIEVEIWRHVARGEQVGTIGNAGGLYLAHLHFELRSFLNPYIGSGYREVPPGWMNPTGFVRANRGQDPGEWVRSFFLRPRAGWSGEK